MPDALKSTEGIVTMASAVAEYCTLHALEGDATFEKVARRVIEIYERGITDVTEIIVELKRLDQQLTAKR